jgi:anti-anti-sigma factor
VIVEPSGAINARAATSFEREVLGHLESGARIFVIDFAEVELFTSAGIRVLVMLSQRLTARQGRLVLCGMSQHVQIVFDIVGLKSEFQIVGNRAEALSELVRQGSAASAVSPATSSLTRRVLRLLDPDHVSRAGSMPAGAPSELTRRVRASLERGAPRSVERRS